MKCSTKKDNRTSMPCKRGCAERRAWCDRWQRCTSTPAHPDQTSKLEMPRKQQLITGPLETEKGVQQRGGDAPKTPEALGSTGQKFTEVSPNVMGGAQGGVSSATSWNGALASLSKLTELETLPTETAVINLFARCAASHCIGHFGRRDDGESVHEVIGSTYSGTWVQSQPLDFSYHYTHTASMSAVHPCSGRWSSCFLRQSV